MSDTKEIRSTSRRDLLKLAGLAAGVAGAAAAVSTAGAAAPVTRAEDGGYRETDHIRKYYELAR
ncbi:MAG: formate dehydrogenase [Rhodospirillales bacterium]|nr:formate dehydrogenase [Rhodospirillales bacterium]